MNQLKGDNNEEILLIVNDNQISQPDTQPAKVQLQPTITQQILELVKSDDYNYYQYPPSLEKAQIHREAYYLCPDKSIVDKYAKEECECCKKKIYRKPFNWLCGDLYEFTEEFGVSIPLYFSIIKFQIVIFVIVFCLYGIFFMQLTQQLCQNSDTCDTIECRECQFSQTYHFTDIVTIQEYLLHQVDTNQYNYYQAAAFIVFLINLHLPFFYDLLVSYVEIKFSDKDPFQSQTETAHSIYVRHLQHKYDPQEIFNLIKASIGKNPNPEIAAKAKALAQPLIEEIVYIHDTSEIIKLQAQRQELFSKIVSLAYKLDSVHTNQVNQDLQFQELFAKLQGVNIEIEKYVGNVKFTNSDHKQDNCKLNLEQLPFSKKAIIRFREESVYRIILSHFKRTFWQDLKIKLNFIIHPKILDKIAVKKSYRINGLFWEHIGMKSYDRVVTKIKSLVIMILACIALMVAYELIYLYANDPEFKANKTNGNLTKAEKAATNIFTILVPIITTGAILIVIINQKKAKKNTFSHQERGYMHFLIVVNYLLVTFVPYIITFEFWNGKQFATAIYNLVTLTQNKLITKNIFHTFHIRLITNLLKKRKAIKNYANYFQGELNNLLTPAAFPQRSRNCNAMYSLTIGLCLIYVCPLITLICFFFNCYIYLYDRYSITHFYTLDKRFTIALMRHQIKVYSIAFYPIKIYLFIKIFWDYGWLIYAGVPICIGISIIAIIFRRKIVNFILFHIFGIEKKQTTTYQPQTYTQSYYDYIKDLKIDEQNQLSQKILKLNPQI